MTCGSPKFGHRKSKMTEKHKKVKKTFSPRPGYMFSYPKCYHNSKNRRHILNQIWVTKGEEVWDLPLNLGNDPHLSLWNHIFPCKIFAKFISCYIETSWCLKKLIINPSFISNLNQDEKLIKKLYFVDKKLFLRYIYL